MRLLPFVRLGLFLASVVVASAAAWTGAGPVSFRITVPAGATAEFEPLLSIGRPGDGDVIFFRRLANGQACFGWEQTSSGAVFSPAVDVPHVGEHTVMLSLGSLLPAGDGDEGTAALRGFTVVQFDGRTVLAVKGKFAEQPKPAGVLGRNLVGGALASGVFSGNIQGATSVSADAALAAAPEARALLPPGAAQDREESEYPGPVRIRLMFPSHLIGRNEPIVVTGVTGRGDFIFVRYVDEQHIRVGFDHWLVGGPLTEPIACDYAVPHELTISMGSLLEPAKPGKPDTPEMARLRTHCLVQLDGKTIIACASAFHPTKAEQINLGANRIGGSTAESLFYGDILRAERIPMESVLPALATVK
jgi:hypothetical protein